MIAMSEMDAKQSPDDERFSLMEARRASFDQILWQVPVLSLAGQSFLLSIVLNPATTPMSRLLASLVALAFAVVVLQNLVRTRFTEQVYSEWVNTHEMSTVVRVSVRSSFTTRFQVKIRASELTGTIATNRSLGSLASRRLKRGQSR